ncbi:MAG: LPXTG cell wall anchor domain-containing protein, partial [Firmicutes bacterium]|nr:LPXTG cell wall anchor domain-containing protein [Bacillota bacterium]
HLFANWKAKVYNAKWVDEDGKTVLHGPVDFTVEEGQPKDTDYNKLSGNEDPTKAEDDDNTYEFSGWKEEVDEDGNVTYTAQYDPTPKPKVTEEEPVTHNATWVDEDGETELNKETFKDGEDAPKADSFTAPEKEGKEFDHWDEEKVKDEDGKETGDVIYTAVYKPIDVPNTGDMARPELWIVAGILSMLGFVLLARKRREEE